MPTERVQHRRTDLPDMSVETIAGRRFAQSWRGYDQEEVKQFLADVAEQVRALKQRAESSEAARRDAEERLAHPQLDEATLTSALGAETAAILRSAHGAAAEVVAKAEATAERLVAEAQSKADELITRAESLLAERTAEAEEAAAEVLEQARAEADETRSGAEEHAAAVAAEAARNHDELVQSAHDQREKVLSDLARRRKLATVQIEQLRAGRERLLSAYLTVRRTLEEVTEELQRADAEARAASDAVGRDHAVELEELKGDPSEVWSPADQVSPASGAVVLAPKVGQLQQKEGPGNQAPAGASQGAGPLARPQIEGAARRTQVEDAERSLTGKAGGDWRGMASSQSEALVAPTAAFESVRIVRTSETETPAAKEAPPVAKAEAPAAEEAPTTAEAAPAAEEAEAPAAEEAPTTAAAEETEESEEAQAPAAEEAQATTTAEAEAPATEAPGPGGSPAVEDLFARIRAGRAEATTKAKKALEEVGEVPAEVAEVPAANGQPRSGDEPLPPKVPRTEEPVTSPGGTPAAIDEEGDDAGEAEREFLSRRDELTGRLESSLARKLKRALQDEQNALLDRLRSLKGPLGPSNVLPSAEEHPDRFIDAGRPLLEEAARAGATLAAKVFASVPRAAEVGPAVVEDLAEELGKAIADPLRQRLEQALRGSGGEAADIADALGAAYREWKTQRIEAAAHDQVAAAFSRGAYLSLPDDTFLRWVVDESEGPCPDCEDNTLARGQKKGDPWPTGQLYPPAHPGCRCALAPEHPLPAPKVAASAGKRVPPHH